MNTKIIKSRSFEKYFQLTSRRHSRKRKQIRNRGKLSHNLRAQKRYQNASNCNRLEDTAVLLFYYK